MNIAIHGHIWYVLQLGWLYGGRLYVNYHEVYALRLHRDYTGTQSLKWMPGFRAVMLVGGGEAGGEGGRREGVSRVRALVALWSCFWDINVWKVTSIMVILSNLSVIFYVFILKKSCSGMFSFNNTNSSWNGSFPISTAGQRNEDAGYECVFIH